MHRFRPRPQAATRVGKEARCFSGRGKKIEVGGRASSRRFSFVITFGPTTGHSSSFHRGNVFQKKEAKPFDFPEQPQRSLKALDEDEVGKDILEDEQMLNSLEYSEGNDTEHAHYDGSFYDDDSVKANTAMACTPVFHLEAQESLSAIPNDEEKNTVVASTASCLDTPPTAIFEGKEEEARASSLHKSWVKDKHSISMAVNQLDRSWVVASSSSVEDSIIQEVQVDPETLNTILLQKNPGRNGGNSVETQNTPTKLGLADEMDPQTAPKSPDKKELKEDIVRLIEQIRKLEAGAATAQPLRYVDSSQLAVPVLDGDKPAVAVSDEVEHLASLRDHAGGVPSSFDDGRTIQAKREEPVFGINSDAR
jgi:hypothetical protein